MDGVGTPIIGRPRPLPSHDTPNPAHNTYTLKCEEPAKYQMRPVMIIAKVMVRSISWITCGNLPSLPIVMKLPTRNVLPVARVSID